MKARGLENVRLEVLGQDEWNLQSEKFRDSNFQQNWAYADCLARRRSCTHEEIGIWEGDTLIGLASVRIRKLPRINLGVAYVAGGPLVNRGTAGDEERFRSCLAALNAEYVQRRKLALRVLAPIGDARWNEAALTIMSGFGMVPCGAGRGYRTFIVDMRRPLDDIRKSLAQKWRNCLNSSEKMGLSIRWTSDRSAFKEFQQAHELFVKNKGFGVELDAEFYATVRGEEPTETTFELAIVEFEERPVAAHLGSYLGDTAVYLLGLTEDAALETKAAYYLHWEVIKRAHERGMDWYDLGGIDPGENPGVYKFKAGFRGEDVSAAGTMEKRSGLFRSMLLRSFESILQFKR